MQRQTSNTADGSTATVALIQNGRVTIGHLGDSLAFLLIKKANGDIETHQLTTDHVPANPYEAEALRQRGGDTEIISKEGVDNVLCVARGGYPITRALGGRKDKSFNVKGVSFTPDIKTTYIASLEPEDQIFLVVASDGLTEKRENDGRPIGNTANGAFTASSIPLQELAQAAFAGNDDAVSAMVTVAKNNGSIDNVTALFTELKPDTSKVLAVFDGHGGLGAPTAEIAANTLKHYISQQREHGYG